MPRACVGARMGRMALHITGDPAADELLSTDPFALLVGMLLDQQVAMETAFAGPLKISQRVGSVVNTYEFEVPEGGKPSCVAN